MHSRSTWCVGALALILSFGSAIAAPEKPAPDAPPQDGDIATAVEREFRNDRALPFDDITVTASDGIVSLRGTVDHMLARDRAARRAETVRGVKSVVNLIAVVPLRPRSDEQIADAVRSALLADPATEATEVDVVVEAGKVTLSGSVDSWHERTLSATVAKGVAGARALSNQIVVVPKQKRPDVEIEREIEALLLWNVYVNDAMLDIQVQDGVVRLSGIVGSAAEKRMAKNAAWTNGVKDVVASAVTVAPWTHPSELRKQPPPDLSDAKIEAAIQKAFLHDPRIYAFNVTPRVDDGLVTLVGVVDNLRAARSAEQDARNTVGVRSVLNLLKVRTTGPREDSAIKAAVEAGFERDPYVTEAAIEVDVANGRVRLTGAADTLFERQQADELASRVRGVRDIVNRIRVVDRPLPLSPYVDTWPLHVHDGVIWTTWKAAHSDLELEHRIRAELLWSPWIDESTIDVTVEDGVATLTGTADSWLAYKLAGVNAYEAGAISVKNDVEVAPQTDSAQ